MLDVEIKTELWSSEGSSLDWRDSRDLSFERTPESSLTEHNALSPEHSVMSGKEELLLTFSAFPFI